MTLHACIRSFAFAAALVPAILCGAPPAERKGVPPSSSRFWIGTDPTPAGTVPFCLPGGPESLVEVVADKPFELTYEPIVVDGRMAVLDDDLVYCRITSAVPVKP
jgi:hypothetical protein